MKIFALSAVAALAFSAFSAPVLADELLITGASDKKGGTTVLALDLVSDGTTRGFDFVIPVSGKNIKVDTSQCFSNLPAKFQGSCQFNGTEITGIAFAWEKVTLPAGVHSIGTVSIKGGHLEKKGADYSVEFKSANMAGGAISSTVRADLGVESVRSLDGSSAEK